MKVPLLQTKLYLPSIRSSVIYRERLTQQMGQGRHNKLTLICAPAGFGKTTLASEWLGQQKAAVAWVSLDDKDNDPTRFFSYLFSALNQTNETLGRAGLDALSSPNPPAPEILITHLLNEFTQTDKKIVLTLDDYHLITVPEIHETMEFLLENLPSNLHLLMLSRAEPPLPIAKLRARNQLIELSAADLRFTDAEIKNFLNHVMGLGLSDAQISELESQTEGWITGLQLFALSIKDAPSAPDLNHNISGSDRYVADYLIDEVLAHLPEPLQDFLLKTSILDRLCSNLCDAVVEIEDSQAILEHLEKANLFLIPLDNTREWYRYHHLFAELLVTRLTHKYSDELSDLYQRAFDWHRSHNFLEEAVQYALQGQLYDQAADVVEEIGHQIYWQNRSHTVEEWLYTLPESLLQSRPHLIIFLGYVHIDRSRVKAAEETMERLRHYLDQNPSDSQEERLILSGKEKALRCSVLYHRYLDGQRIYESARSALEVLPAEYFYDRCPAAFHGGGGLLLLGDLPEARHYLNEALTVSDIMHNPVGRLLTLSNYGRLEMVAGNLERAKAYFQETYDLAQQMSPRQGSTFSIAVVGLGNLYYEWNDLEAAHQYLLEGLQVAERVENDFLDRLLFAYRSLIRFHITRGEFTIATQMYQQAARKFKAHDAPPRILALLELTKVQLALAESDLSFAERWATKNPVDIDQNITYEHEDSWLTLAQVHMAHGRLEQAMPVLQRLLTLAQTQGRAGSIIQIQTHLAQACYHQGELEAALTLIQDVVNRAEPEGYLRTILDCGGPTEMLLGQLKQKIKENGETSNYLDKLVAAFATDNQSQPNIPPPNVVRPPNESSDLLTNREQEVLHFLADGLSYAKIASHLAITENTLKYHVKNIYGKLDVRNRMQAVLKAQDLELL